MNSKSVEAAVSNTIDNTIKRELDCFTDEIIKSDNIYHFSSKSHIKTIKRFLEEFNSTDIESNYETFDFTQLTEKDLLIIITQDEENKLLLELTSKFKKNGGHVITLIEDRNSELVKYAHEVLGVNINESDSINVGSSEIIFEKTTFKLLEYIETKAKKILSMTEKDYSYA